RPRHRPGNPLRTDPLPPIGPFSSLSDSPSLLSAACRRLSPLILPSPPQAGERAYKCAPVFLLMYPRLLMQLQPRPCWRRAFDAASASMGDFDLSFSARCRFRGLPPAVCPLPPAH